MDPNYLALSAPVSNVCRFQSAMAGLRPTPDSEDPHPTQKLSQDEPSSNPSIKRIYLGGAYRTSKLAMFIGEHREINHLHPFKNSILGGVYP